jgi:AcrR family transcriptional regulator
MTVYEDLVFRISEIFLDHGCDAMTMSDLARHCQMTRRGLYHHFSSKDEAFRETIRLGNERTRRESISEGERLIAEGAGLLDMVTSVLDVRYGETRRRLARSPFAHEVNDYAFRICRPVMIEAARLFQADFVRLLECMADAGSFTLGGDVSLETLVQLLCDGARGTNQSFFAPALIDIRDRYRQMSRAILYGCVAPDRMTKP